MSWETYETLYRGAHDRRLQRVLTIAAHLSDVPDFCAGTMCLLARAGVAVDLVLATEASAGGSGERVAEGLGLASLEPLGFPSLALDSRATDLRAALVGCIRNRRPDVVISADPTPGLRQHPDHRAVARCAMDAAWPYAAAGSAWGDGPSHQPSEAWLYAGAEPDLFVTLEPQIQVVLSDLIGLTPRGEETFTQVDLRSR
jgi:LmbE family N-acetylglucosaminyl deacetylase